MIPLLRKDLGWLLLFLLAGTVASLSVLGAYGYAPVWVLPSSQWIHDLQHAIWIPAAALGVFAALIEDLLRTRDHLHHRAIEPQRIFWTRALAALAVVWLSVLLAAALQQPFGAIGGDTLVAAGPARLPVLLALAAFGGACFAALHCGFTFPAPLPARAAIGGAAWLLVLLLHATLSVAGDGRTSAPVLPHLLAMLTATALLLLAAARQDRVRFDPDHPPQQTTFAGPLPLLLCVLVATGTLGLAAAQDGLSETLRDVRPRVAELRDGRILLVGRSQRDGTYPVLDRSHAPTGERIARNAVRDWSSARGSISGVSFAPFEPQFLAGWQVDHLGFQGTFWRQVALSRDDGRLFGYSLEFGSDGGEWQVVALTRPGDQRFSTGARVHEFRAGSGSERTILISDPEDGTVHQIAIEGEQLVLRPMPLPDGERFVRAGTTRTDTGSVAMFVGDRGGRFRWDGSGWTAAPAAAAAAAPAGLRADRDDDPLTPELVLRAQDGAERFRHEFALHRFDEKLGAALLVAPALLRPLPAALLGTSVDSDPLRARQLDWLADPVLRSRPWLLALVLLVTLLFTWHADRRLRRVGAAAWRRRAWAAAILGAGVFGWLTFLLLETRRAHRNVTPLAPHALQPWIRSA